MVAADVSDPAAVRAMMASIRNLWGGIDFLINNAGIVRDRSVAKMTPDEWQGVLDVNLSGVFYCCKFGLEVMRDGGAIVNMGSLAADAGFHGQANYAAAKAGVHALTRVLSRECARRSIRVNAVAPGLIDTPMAASFPEPLCRNPPGHPLETIRKSRRSRPGGSVPLLATIVLCDRARPGGRRWLAGLGRPLALPWSFVPV